MLPKMLGVLAVLLAACATAAQTPTPAPTPIAHNADWTPMTETFDGVEMVFVPPGCFQMGNEEGRRDERPIQEICFETGFWIDRTEVTNERYGSDGIFPGANRPYTNLTWFEARDFCAAHGGRLPTEAEWEYAARGPDNLIYPWGNELVAENLAFDQNNNNEVAEVGSYPDGVSWVGAQDMSGNAWEWVSSSYAPYPYDAADGRENLEDATAQRVFRSGVNSYIDFGVSTAIRFKMPPDGRDWFVGFRCARSA